MVFNSFQLKLLLMVIQKEKLLETYLSNFKKKLLMYKLTQSTGIKK